MKSEKVIINKNAKPNTSTKIEIRVLDFLEEFTKAMFDSLGDGEKKHGNKWLVLPQDYPRAKIDQKFDRLFDERKPINWASVAGYAMIAWIRENHPELWDDPD